MIDRVLEIVYLWLYRLLDLPALSWIAFGLAVGAVIWARRRLDAACLAGASVASVRWASGAAAAREILHMTDLDDIGVERVSALFEDEYDASGRVVMLSHAVHDRPTVVAVALAAVAVGHALQDRRREAPLLLLARDAVLIAQRLTPATAALLFALGLLIDMRVLMIMGLAVPVVGVVLAFGLVRLEIDVGHRARRALAMGALVDSTQVNLANHIIGAAFWRMIASVLPRLRTPRWRRISPNPPVPLGQLGRG